MCGRYVIEPADSREIAEIIAKVSGVKTGEIYPTNKVPIMIEIGEEIVPVSQYGDFRSSGAKVAALSMHVVRRHWIGVCSVNQSWSGAVLFRPQAFMSGEKPIIGFWSFFLSEFRLLSSLRLKSS